MRMFTNTSTIPLALLLIAFSSGCGESSGTVSGKVTINGEPVSRLEVIYVNVAQGFEANGMSNAEGNYKMYYGRANPDLPVGEYKIYLSNVELDESQAKDRAKQVKIPDAFTKSGSQLFKTVSPGDNIIDIAVTAE